MNLKETLKTEAIVQYKKKNVPAYMSLRRVNNAITTLEKSKSFVKANKQVTDEDILKIISTEVKKLKDSVEQISQAHTEDEARQGAIQEHIDSTNKEIAVLSAYLPQELSKEEIQSVVDEVIAESDNPNMGLVMKGVMSKIKSREDGKTADGRAVKEAVQASL